MHERYLIETQNLVAGAARQAAPLALIDLDQAQDIPCDLALPSCPVVGFGNAAHPLAEHLDAVAESSVQLAAIVQQVTQNPLAASALVTLLRQLPGLSLEQGLVSESLGYGARQAGKEHRDWLARQAVTGRDSSDGSVDLLRDDGRLDIVINRPDSGNAINRVMRDALREAFELAALDRTIASVHLSAVGRTFSLGAELSEFGTTRDPAEAHRIRKATLPAHAIIRCADRLSVHVQGGCIGAGLEMAAFAWRITASPDAWFQLPELAMGLIPGAGGCVSLTRRIGRQHTALIVLTGRRISAKQALCWGLIDEITAQDGGAHVMG